MSKRDDGTFSRSEFRYDRKRNVYICPVGETLSTSSRVNSDHAIRYFASVPRCRECPLKQRCCPNTQARRIVRDINEDARDIARRKMKAKAFLKSRDQRKRVEMHFAHLKTHPASSACGSGAFRRTRRVPPRRHRAKPQDHGAPVIRAAARTGAGVTCVDGVNVAITPVQPGTVM